MIVILEWLSQQVIWISLVCFIGAIAYGVTALIARRRRDRAQFTLEREVYHQRMSRSLLVAGLFLALAAVIFWVSLYWAPPEEATIERTPTPSSGLFTLTPVPPTATPTPTVPTPTNTPLPSPTATLTPKPTPFYGEVSVSEEFAGAYIRQQPTLDSPILTALINGSLVEIIDPSPEIDEDGRSWLHIRYQDAEGEGEGWVLENLIQIATPVPNW